MNDFPDPDHRLLAEIEGIQRDRAQLLAALEQKLSALSIDSPETVAARAQLEALLNDMDVTEADLRSMLTDRE
jgi:septal ring factor EnvC (AmiA/AmiB activator)